MTGESNEDSFTESETRWQGNRQHELQPDLLIGGKYTLVDKIGEGGMGQVWKAAESIPGRDAKAQDVVLKFLKPEDVRSEAAIDRFVRTYQATKPLHHRNLCPVHDFLQDQAYGCIQVMNFVEGVTLKDYIRNKTAASDGLNPVEAGRMIHEIADGLAAAHEARVIHRDIKPSNILVSQSGRCLVIDFGLAEALIDDAGQSRGVTGREGTLSYMAPEQLRGAKQTEATDQYALALVAWKLLTGDRAFVGDNSQELLRKMQHNSLQHPFLNSGQLGVLRKALRYEPNQRFASILDFAVMLDRACDAGVCLPPEPKPPIRGGNTFAGFPGGNTRSPTVISEKPEFQRPPVSKEFLPVIAGYVNVNNLYVAPDIPDKKEIQAREAAGIQPADPVLALIEVSFLGATVQTVVITESGVHHQRLGPVKPHASMDWDHVAKYRVGPVKGGLSIGGRKYHVGRDLNLRTAADLIYGLARVATGRISFENEPAMSATADAWNDVRARRDPTFLSRLTDAVASFQGAWHIHVRPRISRKTEEACRTAVNRPAAGCKAPLNDEFILAVVDLTAFGNSSEALVMTDVGIRRCGKWVFNGGVQRWQDVPSGAVSVIKDTFEAQRIQVGSEEYDLDTFGAAYVVCDLISAIAEIVNS